MAQTNSELAKQEPKLQKNGEIEYFSAALQGGRIINRSLEELKESLRYAMVKIGLRSQNWPSEEEKGVLIDHIIKNYGGHTVEEIRLAFDLAILRRLDLEEKEITCYENFSCLYFSGIMNAYRLWARQEYELVSKSTQILSIENKEDMSDEAMQMWYEDISEKAKSGKLVIEFVPPMLYEWMDGKGRINKSAPEKWEYLKRSIGYRQSKLKEALDNEDSATNRSMYQEFMRMKEAGCFEGKEIDILKRLSKQIILFEMILEK